MPRTAGVLRGLCFCCGCCCWLSLAAAAAAVDDDQLQAANHGLVCIPHWDTFHGAVHLGTMWRACIVCGAVGSGTADVLESASKTWTVVIRVQICKFHLAVDLSKRSARKTQPKRPQTNSSRAPWQQRIHLPAYCTPLAANLRKQT